MKTVKNPFLSQDKRILGDSRTSDEVSKNLYALSDEIGARFAGTEAYRRAADYMRDRFEAYKLERADLEPFEFTAFRREGPATLRMLAPTEKTLACYAFPYGASTGPKGVRAAVVDVGSGSPDAIKANAKRIKGRIVLADGSGGPRQELYTRCAKHGAVGLLIGNRVPGMVLHTGSVAHGAAGPIPAAGIGYECALELQRLVKGGTVRLELRAESTCEPATTWNVLGELTGTERPEELVIIGGHLDSHDIGPGSFDNGAGAVMVMEAARLLAKQRKHLKRTVRFIGFAGEELGLLGSHYHARTHAKALKKARFMLNCDTPSVGRPHGLGFHKCPKGAAYLAKMAAETQNEILCQNREHRYSDHYPFILQGVPTAGVAGGPIGNQPNPWSHTAADTPDKIPIPGLRDAAAFAAQVLLRAASDPRWPNMRRSAAEVRDWAK